MLLVIKVIKAYFFYFACACLLNIDSEKHYRIMALLMVCVLHRLAVFSVVKQLSVFEIPDWIFSL